MSQALPQTTDPPTFSRLPRMVLVAGVFGGLLGGVTSFAANRFIQPAKPETPKSAKEEAAEDARDVVEQFIGLLRGDKTNEFLEQVRRAYTYMPDDKFKVMKDSFENSRIVFPERYGPSLHQFELIRETDYSPNLLQFIYLERFEHGSLVWRFVMYRAVDRWRIAHVTFYEMESGAYYLP